MKVFVASFVASYLFIFLKAFQQLNVVRDQYLMVVPTSVAMAACEVFVVANMATHGWGWIVLPVGLGSGLGALTSMFIHGRMHGWWNQVSKRWRNSAWPPR